MLIWSHLFERFTIATMTWLTVTKYLFTYDHIYSTCRKHYRSFPYSWLATGFVARVIRRVSLVEQKLPTIPEHLCSPLVFSEFRVARSLFFCVLFCRSLFVLFPLVIMLSVLRLTSFGIFKLFYVYWWRVCEIRFSYPFWHFHISLHTKHTCKVYRLQFQGPTLTLWYVVCWSL